MCELDWLHRVVRSSPMHCSNGNPSFGHTLIRTIRPTHLRAVAAPFIRTKCTQRNEFIQIEVQFNANICVCVDNNLWHRLVQETMFIGYNTQRAVVLHFTYSNANCIERKNDILGWMRKTCRTTHAKCKTSPTETWVSLVERGTLGYKWMVEKVGLSIHTQLATPKLIKLSTNRNRMLL